MPKSKRVLDRSEIVNEIAETICHWDSATLAELAEQVLGHTVSYNEKKYQFEVKE